MVRGNDTENSNIFKEKYNFKFQIKNNYRYYLGGHICDLEEENIRVGKKFKKIESVETVTEIAEYVPQAVFAGMQHALQQ